MIRKRILITVKTYPVLSAKYQELVCTAGFLEDGSWIRIYPVPFRKIDIEKQYQKYHWISADIEKSQKDDRPESFRIVDLNTLEVQEEVPTDKDGVWEARRRLVLKNIQTSKKAIIDGAHANKFSLVVFKPKRFIKFQWEPEEDRDWDPDKIAALEDVRKQLDIFTGLQDPFKVVKKIPYKFFYEFEDEAGEKSRLMIEDWEIGALYWNCFKTTKDENATCELVKKKYWDDFVLTKDIHLFLGTTKEYHFKKAPNPYLVVGVFPQNPKCKEIFSEIKMENNYNLECPICGNTYYLSISSFPECSFCISDRMTNFGLTEEHQKENPNKSYISAGLSPQAIFEYMASGNVDSVYYSQEHNSYNAVCNKPLGLIPGSGLTGDIPEARESAVLYDLEGKSEKGPHFAFYDQEGISNQVEEGKWLPIPLCKKCRIFRAKYDSDKCIQCLNEEMDNIFQ